MIDIEVHPLLDAHCFTTEFGAALGAASTPDAITRLLDKSAPAPLQSDDVIRKAVRDLLRHAGYKPTGRGKPASEYLLGASAEAPIASINVAVDACNGASLHSGLPISVIDLDLSREPLSIRVAPAGASYVFNASGQTIDVAGLLCLFDPEGPCANGVKDAQRTKTSATTRRTLSIVWGTHALPGRSAAVARWYRELLEASGATTRAFV